MNITGIDTLQPFVSDLLKNRHYRSPKPIKPAPFATLRYYKGIIGIILTSAWIARNGKFSNQDWINRSFHMIKLIEGIGGSIEVSGLENLAERKGPVVIVSNHMSLLETFLLPCLIIPFTPMCVVIKKELTEYPGFGKTMSTVNHIAVTRDNPRADFRLVMEKGVEFLNGGVSVLIFPQSTRNPVFLPSEFNTLGEKLAAKAGCSVIPVAVKTDLHGTGRLLKDFGAIDPNRPVRVAFGPPVDPQKEGRQTHDTILRYIGGQLRAWGLPVQDAGPDAAPAVS